MNLQELEKYGIPRRVLELRATDRDSNLPAMIVTIVSSLKQGMPAEYQDISESFSPLISRADCVRLHDVGVTSLEEFLHYPEEQLVRLFPDEHKRQQLSAQRTVVKEESAMSAPQSSMVTTIADIPQRLEIDGTFEGDRYLVKVNGMPVHLTGKSFKYLTKLAWSRKRGENGWIYKDDIEVGFNQARYLYRMKHEISDSLRTSWPIIENNRLGYYRLNLEPEKIQLNINSLAMHPDWEIRSLILQGDSGRQAS